MFDVMDREAALADPADRIRVGVADLAGEDVEGRSADGLSQRIVDLVEIRDRLDAELARTTAVWQRRRAWEADGALSPVAWLTHRSPIASSDAYRLVKTARVINEAPLLAGVLASGDTTTAHVGALGRVSSPRRLPLLAEHDAVLAHQAKRLPLADYTLVVRRWAALADDHLSGDDHGDHRPRNELFAAVTMDGWVDGRFRLDPVSGARLVATLDHLAPPDPLDAPDGPRTLAERRGDALADLAAWYHSGATPSGNPPNLDVVVDVATLNGHTPDRARLRCDLYGIGPVTQATLQQLGCDAAITRTVMAGASVILDMGRTTRLATAAQARAVRIRDTHCVFPSCHRPARWCDIHHITPWTEGGTTNVATMCCLCRRHHTLIHTTKWTIQTKDDGTLTVTHPARGP